MLVAFLLLLAVAQGEGISGCFFSFLFVRLCSSFCRLENSKPYNGALFLQDRADAARAALYRIAATKGERISSLIFSFVRSFV